MLQKWSKANGVEEVFICENEIEVRTFRNRHHSYS